jgi:hypothetical protein
MKYIVKIVYFLFSIFFLTYLFVPSLEFPLPPKDSLQSNEPADTEDFLRRAYFTNYDREQVIEHYQSLFTTENYKLPFLNLRLNYPPEEAQNIIRDQTRSSFLEELVHPFRESLYVNGFKPKEEKDAIFIDNRSWGQKITVRFIPSNTGLRLIIGLISLIFIPVLYYEYGDALRNLREAVRKVWSYQ